MPTGAYLHADGTIEEFQCAPGPAGWRYVATTTAGRIDVAVDSLWRQGRVEVRAGDWLLRGGLAGRQAVWLRAATDLADARELQAPAAGFVGRSPGLLITLARCLCPEAGAPVRVRLVEVTEPVLATRVVDQEWALVDRSTHPTGEGAELTLQRYVVTDLATGDARDLYIAGDVLVGAPSVELVRLDSAPNLA